MGKQNKNNGWKIVKTILGLGVLGLGGYVFKEVKHEYDEVVAENNRLRNFIDKHDFYKKSTVMKDSNSFIKENKSFEKKTETTTNNSESIMNYRMNRKIKWG